MLRLTNFEQFRFAEKVSPTMSSYFSAFAILMLVLSPLFIPVAITVAPLASSGIRRVGRALGLYRRGPASPSSRPIRKVTSCPSNSPHCSGRR